ncbi:Carboxypeptidase Q [Orchesella cincta]|uniref:Carboxypeptidase Q n=1 Tax=Orchesella cincta TaxID=48709 RepID=A0A1D2MPF5_ORCCI|nr:Carboxypeptidase Q [Orchesella cincta]
MHFKPILSAAVVCLILSDFTQAAGISNGIVHKSSGRLAAEAIAVSYRESQERFLQSSKDVENCPTLITDELRAEIAAYQPVANQIMEAVVNGAWKSKTYDALHDLVDKYPIRQSGHKNLEDSIDYMMEKMTEYGFDNVRGEQVLVPHWVRGEESAEMLAPHQKKLRILGLGTTVGTPQEGITAEVLVVKNFADLDAKKDQVRGKIVVYNQGWLGSYGATVAYRSNGASHASQYGAVATLIQSVAPFSLDTPHTGGQNYWDWENVTHIPTACITVEDADFMLRLQEKGETIRVHLKMLDYNLPMTTSRNAIGEIGGVAIPTEYVAVSGHIDSWDLGQGAMDDAGGVMISVMALAVLKDLNLIPKRKLQAILWTSEEAGLWGVDDFAKQHLDILSNYSAVFESDGGTFKPLGWTLQDQKLLAASLIEEGVPGLSNNNEADKYFWYHHTEADTITMMDSVELDLNTAMWAVSSYVIADLSVKLPRDDSPAKTVITSNDISQHL